MPINLDTRSAIRHPDLGKVIQAVIDADDHDESDWIEWKSNLDLPTKKGSFAVARTILGMANRMPRSAALVCDGLGYIIVGAEPGNLSGVVSVDPAVLDQLLEPGVSSPKRGDFEVLLQVEPRPYGEPTPTSLSRSLSSSHRIFSPQIAVPPVSRTPVRQRSWTEKGSVTIKFDIGDLRQEATDTSEEHYLFLPECPPDGTLHGTWKATVPEIHGVIRGTLQVPIRKDPVDFHELLDQSPADVDGI